MSFILATSLFVVPLASFGASKPPATVEQLWEIIQRQQQEIEALKQRLNMTEERVEENERKVEVTGEAIEEAQAGRPAKSTWVDRTRLGGYGEIIYNNWDNQRRGGEDRKKIAVAASQAVPFMGYGFYADPLPEPFSSSPRCGVPEPHPPD